MPGSVTGSGAPAEAPAAYAVQAPGGAAAGARADGTTTGRTDGAGTDPSGTTRTTGTPKAPGTAPSAGTTAASEPKDTKAPAKKSKPKPKATKPKPKPKAPAPKVGSGQVAQENEVIRLTNVERAKKGCGKVKLNTKLRKAMRGHTQDMADKNYFSHDSQDGRSPWDRAKAAGYQTPIGENIAKGQRNAADVMNSWMNSPGHKANIMNCDAKAIGVGLSYDGGTAIWGQLFGSA
jgi:uncharacterized protein YkwD